MGGRPRSGWPSAWPAGNQAEYILEDSAAGGTDWLCPSGFWFHGRHLGKSEPHILQAGKHEKPQAGQRDGAGGAEEAIMPDFHESRGQDMLEKAPHEFDDIEAEPSRATAPFPAIGEGNGAIFDGQDAGVGNGYAEDIRCEVFQGRFAVTDGLTVDVPGNAPG